MKKSKIYFILGFTACILLILTTQVKAEENYKEIIGGEPSSNVASNDYTRTPLKNVYSYLEPNSDGTISRIECAYNVSTKKYDRLFVEVYDSNLNVKSKKDIEMELPKFGAFYSTKINNYIVFGQDNPEESNNKEVIRIVKYSKDWKRISSCSLYGENTVTPFSAGSCSLTESNGTLFLHTSHTMYKDSGDGLNHQANLFAQIDVNTMKTTYVRSGVLNPWQNGYVSHSFNQFVLAENDYVYTVDHGDGLPRAICICKIPIEPTQKEGNVKVALPLKMQGIAGQNETGISIGGAELSDQNCIIAGNSIDQTEENPDFDTSYRNIFITTTPKNDVTTESSKIKWITNYDKKEKISVRTPQLVKINENRFMVMWEEKKSGEFSKVKMVIIDGSGNLESDIISIGGRLSDCKPVLYNNKVTWYTTIQGTTEVFFTIDVSSIEKFQSNNNKNILDLKKLYPNFTCYIVEENVKRDRIVLDKFDDTEENVTLPENILPLPWVEVTLGRGLFEDCQKIKTVTIPEGYTTIQTNTFRNCKNLQKVEIPESVKKIEDYAFYQSGNIEKIIIKNSNVNLSGNNIFSIEKTIKVGEKIKPIEGITFSKFRQTSSPDVVLTELDGTITGKREGYTTVLCYDKNGNPIGTLIINVEKAILKGDVDLSGDVKIADAIITLKGITGKTTLTDKQKEIADVNNNNRLDIGDAIKILKYVTKKISTLD